MKRVLVGLISLAVAGLIAMIGQYIYEYYYGKFWKLPIMK